MHPKKLAMALAAVGCTATAAAAELTPRDWFDLGAGAVRQAKHLTPNERRAKSVILFVGDGMGVSTVTAARSLRTIMEEAEMAGLSTGVVTTARLTHATPAVNYAHIGNRNWEADSNLPAGATVKDIAAQLIDFPYGNGIEVALGGGRSRFYPDTEADPEYPSRKGMRKDGRRLHAEWVARGINSAYVWNKAQFDAIDPAATERLLGLFERSHMHYEVDRADDVGGEPSLAEMTAKAIDILAKNPKGYYLMAEAGRVDRSASLARPACSAIAAWCRKAPWTSPGAPTWDCRSRSAATTQTAACA